MPVPPSPITHNLTCICPLIFDLWWEAKKLKKRKKEKKEEMMKKKREEVKGKITCRRNPLGIVQLLRIGLVLKLLICRSKNRTPHFFLTRKNMWSSKKTKRRKRGLIFLSEMATEYKLVSHPPSLCVFCFLLLLLFFFFFFFLFFCFLLFCCLFFALSLLCLWNQSKQSEGERKSEGTERRNNRVLFLGNTFFFFVLFCFLQKTKTESSATTQSLVFAAVWFGFVLFSFCFFSFFVFYFFFLNKTKCRLFLEEEEWERALLRSSSCSRTLSMNTVSFVFLFCFLFF